MTMHLVLLYRGAAAEIELRVEDPGACVGDLTAGIDGVGGPDLGLLLDGRWFGPDSGLDEVGLYEGAVAEITRRQASATTTVAPSHSSGLVVAVVGGPVAGRTFPIERSEVTIGRDATCDIVLDDPSVSRRHATISANAVITDLGSTNGTWIDEQPVSDAIHVPQGALVRMGASQLRLRAADTDDRPVGLPVGGFVPFNRPPRPAPLPPLEPLVAPEAPKPSTSSRVFSIAMIVGPVLMGAGMVVIYGNPRFALFAALAPIIALVTWISSKRSSRKERKRRGRAFAAALEEFTRAIEARSVDERRRREEQLTDAAEVFRRAALPSVTLWQRRPSDGDFLRLRAGIGRALWRPAVPAGRDAPPPEVVALLEQHGALDRSPIEIDLSASTKFSKSWEVSKTIDEVTPIAPCTDMLFHRSTSGHTGTRPGVVRIPTALQKFAGLRSEAPRSEPSANGSIRVATATAAPPDEPPQVFVVSHGLSVLPNTALNVCEPSANSGVFVLPTITMPWRRKRSTITVSASAT